MPSQLETTKPLPDKEVWYRLMIAGYINDAQLLELAEAVVTRVTGENSGTFELGSGNLDSVVIKLDPESDTPGQITRTIADRGEIYHFRRTENGIQAVFADPEGDFPLKPSDGRDLARALLRYYPQ